ncbi:201_t:CDS:2 [Gigaspora rosea]|nr:201_t:CDS:2 [Gigaspora rosea]
MQEEDTVFVDNAFDYPLAHSFTLFKQVEDQVIEVWEVIYMTWQHSRLHIFLLKDVSFICSCMLLVNHRYPCRHFFRVMAYSSVAKFSINFVASYWLYKKYQDEDLGAQPLVNLSTVLLSKLAEALAIPATILRTNGSNNLFSESGTSSIMQLTSSKKAMQKKKHYAETIGIARKAINIAIEKDDSCILRFLKEYILKNECSLVDNTTSESSSNYMPNQSEKCTEDNTILNKSYIKISNPLKRTRRGRPPKSERWHNRRWHTRHENKVYDLAINCEFCGGRGHRKELHNDSIESNELDQVDKENE